MTETSLTERNGLVGNLQESKTRCGKQLGEKRARE